MSERRPYPFELREFAAAAPSAADSEESELTGEACSERFFDLLVQLKTASKLSAKDVCVISYWASKAGLCGRGADLALAPSAESSNYSRHFDRVVGVELDGDWCT